MRPHISSTDILDPNLLQSVVRQATFQCRAEGSGFYLCDPEGGQKTLLATQNLPKEPWDEVLLKEMIDSRQAVVKTLADQSVLMAAPLVWQEAVRGLLIVFDRKPGRIFSKRDIALIQSLADLTASVAQQNERLARMTAQFRTLHTIDVALTSSLELDHVLNLILEKAAELVETLSGPGPFTVFAPTDEAFAQIPEDQLNALLADKEALTAVLTYHVVAGKVMAADVVKLSTAETVNGQSVSVMLQDGKVMIDGAQVITADISTSNGVIHVIDKVILPEM